MDLTAEWFGDRAVLVHLHSTSHRSLVLPVLAAALPDLLVRPGTDALLVESDEPRADLLTQVTAALPSVAAGTPADAPREVVIPVEYDGTDRADAADALGCTVERLVAAHAAQRWRVALLGFAPGFGYLEPEGAGALDWAAVPRRDSPRTRVPRGSVALAAGHSAVYPREMPGGWQVIGRTDVELFDPARPDDPTLLRPGDRVRFERR